MWFVQHRPGRPMNVACIPAAWVAASRRRPLLVLAAAAVLALASILYARGNLGLDTDTADMISADPEWRQTWIELKAAFPQLVDTLLIVADGETPDLADRASRILAAALEAEHALVEWAVRPDALPFFERNALLYLAPGELDALLSRLAEAQPFLGTLAAEPDPAGLAKLLERASAASGPDRSRVDLAPALDAIADTADADAKGGSSKSPGGTCSRAIRARRRRRGASSSSSRSSTTASCCRRVRSSNVRAPSHASSDSPPATECGSG